MKHKPKLKLWISNFQKKSQHLTVNFGFRCEKSYKPGIVHRIRNLDLSARLQKRELMFILRRSAGAASGPQWPPGGTPWHVRCRHFLHGRVTLCDFSVGYPRWRPTLDCCPALGSSSVWDCGHDDVGKATFPQSRTISSKWHVEDSAV